MGNADPEMTALHVEPFGIVEQKIAARMWERVE
jgi:hypothetical protein